MEENNPQWLTTLLTVIAALGGKELLSWFLRSRREDKQKKQERTESVEDKNRELSNQVLLDMIEALKSDINEQKSIEQVLRNQLMNEMSDKVKFQVRLEMLLNQIDNNDADVSKDEKPDQ